MFDNKDTKSDEEIFEACKKWISINLPEGSKNIESLSVLSQSVGLHGDTFRTLLFIGFESGRLFECEDTVKKYNMN